MPSLSEENDEKRAQRVLHVFRRFADEGADRAAQLTVAFFVSETCDRLSSIDYWIGESVQRTRQ